MNPPALRPLCQIRADLGTPMERGSGKGARWRTIPIIGGTVEGERLSGTVMNLGADWQTVLAIGGLALGGLIVVILLRRQIIAAVQDIRQAVEGR